MGHLAKAIDFAKWSVWIKNQNCEKDAKNNLTSALELFYEKSPSLKTPNIRQMKAF